MLNSPCAEGGGWPTLVVVGGGVIGLTVAIESARAGFEVTVVRDRPSSDSVSAVAAAIWLPFEIGPPDLVKRWSLATLRHFMTLAGNVESGVVVREGVVALRAGEHPPAWTTWVDCVRAARHDELPNGVERGLVAWLPIIEMPRYLPWLEAQCDELGVRFVHQKVSSLEQIARDYDAVVVAAGLASATLVSDEVHLRPVRGQVVRVKNPGLERWYLDALNPQGITYVVPRSDDVVCGGTAESNVGEEEVLADVTASIVARVGRLIPELVDCEIVSAATGLRPGREAVRFGRLDTGGEGLVLACYGHGGAGVTTSWGCASDLVELVIEAVGQTRRHLRRAVGSPGRRPVR